MRKLDIDLDRDSFMRTLIGDLAGRLETVVGMEEASGLISLVGMSVGKQINQLYVNALGRRRLDAGEAAEMLADLKRRIHGSFQVTKQDDKIIELENSVCPFEDAVDGHPSLCMMTSNVFGVIMSEHLGYARVEITEAIARGDGRCLVRIHLDPDSEGEASGREYFRD